MNSVVKACTVGGTLIVLVALSVVLVSAQAPEELMSTVPVGRIAFCTDRDGNYDMYMMDANGDNQAPLKSGGGWNWNPDWSPDGTQVAYFMGGGGVADLYVRDLASQTDTRLTWTGNAASPRWSPDGTMIAFNTLGQNNADIHVMRLGENLDVIHTVRLTTDNAEDNSPKFSPLGNQIAFNSYRGGSWDIWVMDVFACDSQFLCAGEPRNWTKDGTQGYGFDWSPDGTQLAVASTRGGYKTEIYIFDPEAGSYDPPLTVDGWYDMGPSWSPDGEWIAYSKEIGGGEIYAVNVETGVERRITDNSVWDSGPDWWMESGAGPTAPTTQISVDGTPGCDGWFVSPVIVTLSAADSPGGPGVAYTEYSLDDGATWDLYTEPLGIQGEGIATIMARSADLDGNVEDPPASETVKIDLPPYDRSVPDMPTGRARGGAAVIGNEIFVIGGHGGGRTHEALDVSTYCWTTKDPLPQSDGRYSNAVVALGGIVYSIGGTNIGGNYNTRTVDAYDPVSDSWSRDVASYPVRVSDLACTTFEGAIYCFGGSDYWNNKYSQAYRFDPAVGVFDPLEEDMPTPRNDLVAAAVGDKIFLIGGAAVSGSTTVVEIYDPVGDSWSTGNDMPMRLGEPTVGVIGGKIYMTGRDMDAGWASPVLRYDPQSDAWTTVAHLEIARTGAMGAVVNDRFYLIGGQGQFVPHLGSVEVVDPPADVTPPTTTILFEGAMGNNGWFVSSAAVTLSATDGPDGSGVAHTEYSLDDGMTWNTYSAALTIVNEGITTILARSADNAENLEDPPASEEVRIDFTPPTIDGSRLPTANANGWNAEHVTVHFDCYDSVSGVASCTADTIVSNEGEGQSVGGTAVDVAGNTAFATVSDINIDLTSPVISGNRFPGANSYGWNNEDVTVSFECSDALSGMAYCTPDRLLHNEGEGQSVTGSAMDLAGNAATTTVGDINIDKTAPTVNIADLSPNPANVSESTDLLAHLADERSGIQSAQWCAESESLICDWEPMTLTGETGDLYRTASASISGLSPGVYSIRVKTQDLADNGSDDAEALLVVYDPSAGFATGGGWIIPGLEPGDILPEITGEDKANFGFVAKYKRRANAPEGQLEFHDRVGDFNLHSTELHWMVINNDWAKFQGYATINLHPDELFYFRVDARDANSNGGNQPDSFILKVWAADQDPHLDDPVYRVSGDLMGGNVVIHTK